MSDDDEEMADLFSFGSSDISGGGSMTGVDDLDGAGGADTGMDTGTLSPLGDDLADRFRRNSSDSFQELFGADDTDALMGALGISTPTSATIHDKETQDMLDWLDEDPRDTEKAVEFDGQDEVVFVSDDEKQDTDGEAESAVSSPKNVPAVPATPTVVELPPQFDNLRDAVSDPRATVTQIRVLAKKTPLAELDDPSIRPDLYCRLVCGGKNAEQTQTSSLADSFLSWVQEHRDDKNDDTEDTAWIAKAAEFCMESILKETNNASAVSKQDLVQLLRYNNTRSAAPAPGVKRSMDRLVPCVAATILAAGIPLAAASVVLGQMQADYMPLTALQEEERWEAALALHHALYLLACYHLPLLVFHLDRYLPGWFGPRLTEQTDDSGKAINERESSVTERARNLDKQGQIPPSWLLSFLSGQVLGKNLPTDQVLRLWDAQFTQGVDSAQSLRFFLTLAVLERAADDLILVTGEALTRQLQEAFLFPDMNDPWFQEWMPAAQDLYRATPTTVLQKLQTAEDEAVQSALIARQARAEAALQERLQAEAAAHQEAQEKKADEARQRLTRARLVAFYRKHAPDKEDNIDRILTNYADRMEVLDAKLFRKYGESFEPALKPKDPPKPPKPQKHQRSQSSNILQNFGRRQAVDTAPSKEEEAAVRKPDQVSVLVSASEVLPIICWTKGGPPPGSMDESSARHEPLKYFLVDSRSTDAATEQGRFPTAVAMSPEDMLDPERVMQHEEMFEALRGAVHIVVMGEGFSAIPTLYKQKLSPNLEAAMVQDESRTNICALFFIKKGFPFVSVLDGGFASAHAWLAREGSKHNLRASSVLVDYAPDASVFGQMETLHNSTVTEKAQRQLTNLVEKSLVAMTLQAAQLEKLAAEMEAKKKQNGGGMGGLRLGSLFRGASQQVVTGTSNTGPAAVSATQSKQVEELKLDDGASDEDNPKASNSITPQSPANPLRKSFANPLRNPFARKADAADEKSTLARTKSSDSMEKVDTSTTPTQSDPSPQSPASPKSNTDPDSFADSSTGAPSPAGAGGMQNTLKRNPFRFGGGGGNNPMSNRSKHNPISNRSRHNPISNLSRHNQAPNKSKHERSKSSGGGALAGFANLRKSTLGRIRSAPGTKDVIKNTPQDKEEEEESISFD